MVQICSRNYSMNFQCNRNSTIAVIQNLEAASAGNFAAATNNVTTTIVATTTNIATTTPATTAKTTTVTITTITSSKTNLSLRACYHMQLKLTCDRILQPYQ